ncbi:unnamed protein product [Clonostachys rosea]|uniref:Xylanolytic transcriptional activator regulatory domain-containing protein n=1 Tax=Bionectria ochroleuca TaxID=29856 RepID=A0ABY6U8Y8_BIOOC|nr:unnamed protein product [Clonostachys rosea]
MAAKLKGRSIRSRSCAKGWILNPERDETVPIYEIQDRIVLIQCVLLMGFWYCDTVDRNGPWHWTGVAISLCQTAGLHRQPDSRTISGSHGRYLLWRHLWWACVHRDALYSMGLGRPMRINLDDCDLELPDAGDYCALLAGIPENLQKKYLPHATEELSRLWVELLRLTVVQAQILSTHYRAKPTCYVDKTSYLQIESQISASYNVLTPLKSTAHDIVYYHVCHLELFAKSMLVVLYRPYLLDPTPLNQVSSLMRRKAQTAATGFNQVLSSLIAADMIRCCQSMVCVALVPPMQVHLLDSTSNLRLVQSMGVNNLELCMLVVKEIRNTWFGAEVVHRMFRQARFLIEKRISHQRDEDSHNIDTGEVEATTEVLPDDTEAAGEADPLFDFRSPYTGLEGFFTRDEYLMSASSLLCSKANVWPSFGMFEVDFELTSILPTEAVFRESAGTG